MCVFGHYAPAFVLCNLLIASERNTKNLYNLLIIIVETTTVKIAVCIDWTTTNCDDLCIYPAVQSSKIWNSTYIHHLSTNLII